MPWGVRYQRKDGTTFDSWGYTEDGAKGHAATCHGKGWDPQVIAVLHSPDEPAVTVELHQPEMRPQVNTPRQRNVTADNQPRRTGNKRVRVNPTVTRRAKKDPIAGMVGVRVSNRP